MKKVIIRFICIGLLAIGMYALPRFGQVQIPFIDSCIAWAAYPFIILQDKVVGPFKQWAEFLRSQRELIEQSERYKAEGEELLKRNIELASLVDTWGDIEELILFKKRYTHTKCITGQIILKQFSPAAHFFYLDAGSQKGVAVDMVAVYKNCLIGRVSEVYPLYSRVTLITDSACKIAAFCQNAPYAGIHEGCGTLYKTRLTYVFDPELQAKKKIKKDDLVISSGQGGVFPKGFGLGKVQDIEYDNFQCMLTLQPLVDFRKLKYCMVIAKGAEYDCSEQVVEATNAPLEALKSVSTQQEEKMSGKTPVATVNGLAQEHDQQQKVEALMLAQKREHQESTQVPVYVGVRSQTSIVPTLAMEPTRVSSPVTIMNFMPEAVDNPLAAVQETDNSQPVSLNEEQAAAVPSQDDAEEPPADCEIAVSE